LPDYARLAFVVAYHCGCRKGELLAIPCERVDLAASKIYLVAEMRSALPKAKEVPPEPDITSRIQTAAQRCAESLSELEKISRKNDLGIVRVQIRAELHV
jgi:hypothetical protein